MYFLHVSALGMTCASDPAGPLAQSCDRTATWLVCGHTHPAEAP